MKRAHPHWMSEVSFLISYEMYKSSVINEIDTNGVEKTRKERVRSERTSDDTHWMELRIRNPLRRNLRREGIMEDRNRRKPAKKWFLFDDHGAQRNLQKWCESMSPEWCTHTTQIFADTPAQSLRWDYWANLKTMFGLHRRQPIQFLVAQYLPSLLDVTPCFLYCLCTNDHYFTVNNLSDWNFPGGCWLCRLMFSISS